ncbi:MAG: hypothetical protein H6978_14900 [Gammaproteobacteria bacterium]|nr:hypothetical protein [Gammaproteobacteria bacterium]
MADTSTKPEPRTTTWRMLATLAALALVVLAATGGLDQYGTTYTEASLKRALVAFGISRTLDGVISVAQATEISLEPGGVGVTLAPAEILDPVNDLVEQFSGLVLVAATSLGVQRVLLEVAAWWPVTVALGVLMAILVALWWRGEDAPRWFKSTLKLGLAVLFVVRFAVPCMAVASAAIYSLFLEPHYEQATEQLEVASGRLQTLNEATEESVPAATDGDPSLLERARRAYAAAGQALDIRQRLDSYTAAAAGIADHAVELTVVFVIETLLMPLAFLWLMSAVMRGLAARLLGSD